jgi:hypothetical protein
MLIENVMENKVTYMRRVSRDRTHPASLLRGDALATMIGCLIKSEDTWPRLDEVPSANLETLVISQKHLVYGELTVFLNEQAIRVDGRRTGISIIAMAPDWDVFVCNLSTRKAYRTTANNYKSQIAQLIDGLQASSDQVPCIVKNAFTRTFAGRLCHCWQTSPDFELYSKRLFNRATVAANFPKQIEVWATESSMTDAQKTLLSRFYGIPEVPGIPIHVSFKRVNERSALLLETTTCATQILPSSFFKFPKHCSMTTETDFCKSPLSLEYLLQ